MAEFEMNGERYLCTRLNAFEQGKLVKRLAGLFVGLVDEKNAIANLGAALQRLSDEDYAYILDKTLNTLQRYNKDPGNWVPVWNSAAKQAMFADLNEDFMALIPLVAKVLQVNLANFFKEPPTDLAALMPQKTN